MQEAALCRNIKTLRLCTTKTTPRAVDFWGVVSSFMGQCSVEMDIHVIVQKALRLHSLIFQQVEMQSELPLGFAD